MTNFSEAPGASTSPAELLAVARGDEPADLVLRGGRLVNVLSGEIQETTVAIHGEQKIGPDRTLGSPDGARISMSNLTRGLELA